ncbi:MAG: DUF3108 domain-containing protein [Thermodesulfovibrionales bacterium]|jgi:hypothetical protein
MSDKYLFKNIRKMRREDFCPPPSLFQRGKNIFSLCMFVLLFSLSFSGEVFPFQIPETLLYDLTWAGIKAGEASLRVKGSDGGLIITSTAKSAQWISLFYTVDDWAESRLTGDIRIKTIGHPVNYKLKIREGRRRKNKEVIFARDASKAIYIDYLNGEKKAFDVPSVVFDPLSSFFHLRTRDLEVGKSVYVPVFDNRKIQDVEVQVLRKEKVEVPAGEFNTVVVRPLIKSEGIFERKGTINIWLTDDEKRIPVKLKTKVKVGSITAYLVGGSY